MRKVVRRSTAGAMVGALVDGLSADLLMDEEECRQNMEALFVGAVPAAAETLVHVIAGGHRDVAPVATKIRNKAGVILSSTEEVFRVLVDTAVAKGLESVRVELEHCEATLGSRFAGITTLACDAVDDAQDQLVTLGMMQYRANASTVLGWFMEQLILEMGVSLHLQEDPGVLVARLVSPASVRVEQHVGRGLWWKVLEHCNRISREIEFATVNAARTEAMMQFNRIGEGRRSG